MYRPLTLIVVTLLTGVVGFVAGWGAVAAKSSRRAGSVVAVRWGDAVHAKAHYGAFVYLRQKADHYSVRARVYLGRGSDQFHDCGELGKVQTPAEAVERWSAIEWAPEGLRIGGGTNQYFLARADLQKASGR